MNKKQKKKLVNDIRKVFPPCIHWETAVQACLVTINLMEKRPWWRRLFRL